jgi:hypothetical protein
MVHIDWQQQPDKKIACCSKVEAIPVILTLSMLKNIDKTENIVSRLNKKKGL